MTMSEAMTMSEGMLALRNDLQIAKKQRMNATAERKKTLKNIKSATQNDLRNFRLARQQLRDEARDEWNSFRDELVASNAELREETRALLKTFRKDREDSASVLKRDLKELRENLAVFRQKTAAESEKWLKECHSERKKESEAQREALFECIKGIESFYSDLKDDVKEMLAEYHHERTSSRQDLRTILVDYRAEILAEVNALLSEARSARNEGEQNLRAMQQVDDEPVTTKVSPAPVEFTAEYDIDEPPEERELDINAMRQVEEPLAVEETSETIESPAEQAIEELMVPKEPPEAKEMSLQELKEEADALKEQLLTAICDARDGLSLAEIGEMLEIEWRKLIRPAKVLLDENRVRKDGTLYFAIESDELSDEIADQLRII